MSSTENNPLSKLPLELRDKVFDEVEGFPMTLKDAKDLREELLKEKKQYLRRYQMPCFEGIEISLSEM